MLSRRVTPFNAQDLKTVSEGVSLFTNYFKRAGAGRDCDYPDSSGAGADSSVPHGREI